MAKLIRGRYEPLEVVARGGQGQLIKALDHQHDRQVALKVRRVGSDSDREAILAEGRILLGLTPHPAVAMLREDFFVRDRYYLVMDWVQGESLESLLARQGGPGLPLDEVCTWLGQVAEALDHLHAHDPPIVHGDLKPANIILTPPGQAVLVDFGVAGRLGGKAAAHRGTPEYLAPERAAGEATTPAADIYALGATAVALLTGTPPGLGERPRWKELPEADARRLDLALRRGLASDPSRRPGSASALVESLRSEARVPHNLPAQLTSFIGREAEMAQVEKLLSSTRLLTLTGAGGIGKTRLAIQVASLLASQFPDGAWIVELAGLNDPRLVPQAVASALGVREQPGRGVTETLTDHLLTRHLLLVLDNCEHLVAACAELAETALRSCAHLRVLATSREPLGVAGEVLWRVPSLPVLDLERPPPNGVLRSNEGVRLFVDRVILRKPDFQVTGANALKVAEICHRLDGIPLAIELAAARAQVLTVEQIASRLEDRFQLLAGGPRGALARQQTLRAAVDWSYQLLSEDERTMFNRISVFTGGFTLGAAEAVCSGDGIEHTDVLNLLSGLVDKSLVQVEERMEAARYRTLATMRLYARDRLHESGENARLRGRFVDWCVAFAEQAEPKLTGPDQVAWFDRLEDERENLRTALTRSVNRRELSEQALRLCCGLRLFWFQHGYLSEGRAWLEQALDVGTAANVTLRAKAAWSVGVLAGELGDYGAAGSYFEASLEMAREVDDEALVARSLNSGGVMAVRQSRFDIARSLYEESLGIRRRLGDREGVAKSLGNLGVLAQQQGDYAGARAFLEESLAIDRELGHALGVAGSLTYLGNLARLEGDHERGATLLREGLARQWELGEKEVLPLALEWLAAVEAAVGRVESAAMTFGAAEALREVMSYPLPPYLRSDHERAVALVREGLGEVAFQGAWETGRAMPLEEAIAHALGRGTQGQK